ncbi:MAG: YraN family protein [Actinobacteria bacterium]|nr:YraN family protein [Actinomycetota bacterium]
MGLGHVPQEPLRAEGEGADVQGRQRRGAAAGRPHTDLTPAAPLDQSRRARGRWGEDQAERWYRLRGYEVLARNWRCDAGEIDLVVAGHGAVVVVEVKARASDRFGSASLAVDHRKQRRLRILAARWLAVHPQHHGEVRFDVVAITGTTVEVLSAAF